MHITAFEHYQPVMDGSKERRHHGSVPQDLRIHNSRVQSHDDLDQYEYMNGGQDGTEQFSRLANDTFNEFIGTKCAFICGNLHRNIKQVLQLQQFMLEQ